MKLGNLISGQIKLYETESPINGHVEVTKDLFGTSIKCDGLTQSGDLIEKIWNKPLKKISNNSFTNILIVGLGGESTAKLIRKYWPNAKTSGIDVDQIMVDLGKKYLKLDEYNVNTKVTDAYNFIKSSKQKYDLILVDVYQGREVPEKFDSEEFAKMIKKTMPSDGVVVFNRLYAGQVRSKAVKFLHKLEKVFGEVDPIYPMANVMFICKG